MTNQLEIVPADRYCLCIWRLGILVKIRRSPFFKLYKSGFRKCGYPYPWDGHCKLLITAIQLSDSGNRLTAIVSVQDQSVNSRRTNVATNYRTGFQ